MFTITNKLRMLVALCVVGAALVSTTVASAATVVRSPGKAAPVRVAPPTVVAQQIDPDNVGSAGVPGYDDQKCEDLANQHNSLEDAGYHSLLAGDTGAYVSALNAADDVEDEISDNCMVID
jgi:hypothetical protein